MQFYRPTLNSVQRRKSPEGNAVSIFKFTMVLLFALGIVSFFAWRRAVHNQTMREMRKELAMLDKEQEELKKTLQNRGNQIEHLTQGKYITACAKEIGLRWPTPKQKVIDVRRATAQNSNSNRKHIIGYAKR